MAKNFAGEGRTLEWTNGGAAVAAGDVVATGKIVGIALVDIAAGATGNLGIEGEFSVPRITGVSTAWGLGDIVDWDASLGKFGKGIIAATGDVIGVGFAVRVSADGDATGTIKLANPGT